MTNNSEERRHGLHSGRRADDDASFEFREMLVRIDERVNIIIQRLESHQENWAKLREEVEANTARSIANEIQSNRHESTLTWVVRAVGTVIIAAVLLAAGIGVGPF